MDAVSAALVLTRLGLPYERRAAPPPPLPRRLRRPGQLPLPTRRPLGKKQACLQCYRKFYKPSDLLKHLRETNHSEDVCSMCFDSFESRVDLIEHYSLHDDPKPFFCPICDIRFQTKGLLIQHLPRHSENAPHTCPLCNKGFKWKHGLNSHLTTHTKEKKHLCDECGFTTVHAKTLRAHKLTHTGDLFRCSFPGCAHTCSRKENMKIHQLTHTNEKPFVCEICGQKFSLHKSLKRHALLHNAAGREFACPHCPFKAIRADNLKAHVLRQHPEKPPSFELDEFETDCSPIYESEYKTDLSVLADAASSCSKIQTERFDLSCARNFDNLILAAES